VRRQERLRRRASFASALAGRRQRAPRVHQASRACPGRARADLWSCQATRLKKKLPKSAHSVQETKSGHEDLRTSTSPARELHFTPSKVGPTTSEASGAHRPEKFESLFKKHAPSFERLFSVREFRASAVRQERRWRWQHHEHCSAQFKPYRGRERHPESAESDSLKSNHHKGASIRRKEPS